MGALAGVPAGIKNRGIEKWDAGLVPKLPLPLGDFELP